MNTHTLPSYQEVMELLGTFHNLETATPAAGAMAEGTERMEKFIRRLGSPHLGRPTIHVAGTKGKGSVTRMTAAALAAAGFKTGLYTSPNVETLRERIMINNRPIGEHCFVEACWTALREAEAMREEGNAPSYFEILTATAFVAFSQARVEAMVLETGLGGRLDATNLPDLRLVASGLTAISKDHQEILGNTLQKIAGEKAAIIRKNVPVVSMAQEKTATGVILAKAEECHAPLFMVGKDIMVGVRKSVIVDKPNLGQRLDFETWRNVYTDIPVALLGRHQAENAGLALGLIDLFLEYMDREPLDTSVLKRVWRGLTLPARLEVLAQTPWHIVDGAHNPASAWAAAETVAESFSSRNRTLVFGVAADKDWRCMLRILSPLFKRLVFTSFKSPRAIAPADLAAYATAELSGHEIFTAPNPAQAKELAESITSKDGVILTTGSLYLAGEMRGFFRREKTAHL